MYRYFLSRGLVRIVDMGQCPSRTFFLSNALAEESGKKPHS